MGRVKRSDFEIVDNDSTFFALALLLYGVHDIYIDVEVDLTACNGKTKTTWVKLYLPLTLTLCPEEATVAAVIKFFLRRKSDAALSEEVRFRLAEQVLQVGRETAGLPEVERIAALGEMLDGSAELIVFMREQLLKDPLEEEEVVASAMLVVEEETSPPDTDMSADGGLEMGIELALNESTRVDDTLR